MNHITIELCAEDRARLDKISELLDKLIPHPTTVEMDPSPFLQRDLRIKEENETPAEAVTEPQEAKEEQTQASVPPTEESVAEPVLEAVEAVEEAKPSISLEQIQQKVIQLSANAYKKANVRSIIFSYGTKVSDLKDQPEKWEEVWEKLTALEKEA